MEIGNSVSAASEATPRISSVSRLRAASGDGTISPETLEAIRAGATPPLPPSVEESNNIATETAPVTTDTQTLQDIIANSNAAPIVAPQDTVDISNEAQQALQAAEAVVVEASQNTQTSVTSQNLAETNSQNATTEGLGNTVDVSS